MVEAKQSGLGDNFYIAGYDLSGDVASVDKLSGGPALIDVTGIKYSAHQRIGALRDGDLQFTTFWDYDTVNSDQEHYILSQLPTADATASYFRGTTVLNPCASCIGKQLNYDPTRDASGGLMMKTEVQANGYGLEWGVMLTPGLRTDGSATVGSFIDDNGGASSFGGQMYWQLIAFTGTSVTIHIEDCATSGGSYSSLMDSGAQTGVGAGRVSVANNTSVLRYLEITTTGTFSNAVFAVHWTRNQAAVVF